MFKYILTVIEASKKISKDNIAGYAAQSCFYITLSFFPCLIVLMSLIQFIPFTPETMVEFMRGFLPTQIEPLVESVILDVYNNSTLTLTSLTAIITIWAAGKGFLAIIYAFDKIYETKPRNWFITRIMSTVYTIIFLFTIIVTLVILVFGTQIVDFTSTFSTQISSLLELILTKKFIVLPCILLLLFLFMYTYIPARKSSFAREFPGAIFSTLGWCLFSFFYSLYVEHSPNFSYMYGSLTTLIFALIWIYSCMIILFTGAELNALISQNIIKLKNNKSEA